MKIEWVTTAAEVIDDGGELTFRGLAGETTPVEDFPCDEAWVQLVICASASFDELGATVPETGYPVPHWFRWSITDPDGVTTLGELGPFGALEPSPWHYTGWDGNMIQPLRVVFDAPREGIYTIAVTVDDSDPWTLRHYFTRLEDLL